MPGLVAHLKIASQGIRIADETNDWRTQAPPSPNAMRKPEVLIGTLSVVTKSIRYEISFTRTGTAVDAADRSDVIEDLFISAKPSHLSPLQQRFADAANVRGKSTAHVNAAQVDIHTFKPPRYFGGEGRTRAVTIEK